MIHHINHPTQLWISDHQTLQQQMIAFLQKQLCKNQTCLSCIICTQIANKEHPWIIWLTPERSYTLEQIDEVIGQANFQLDDQEQRFFIFTQAERLTEQCSNRLLKTIEEPFPAYHFFFLTNRAQALPLTVQSRCVIQKLQSQSQLQTYQELLQPFLQLTFQEPLQFIKQLDALDIKEQETKDLVDELFNYWSEKAKIELKNQENSIAQQMLVILQHAIANQPMTGGSKIFWKNLYLITHYAKKTSKSLV